MIADNKMFSHINRICGDRKPITADIFLTNYCNNKCPYCVYHRWELNSDARAMTFDDFVLYATRLRELGVVGFILTGGGEPTLNPDFEKITGWLEENKLHYGINTNFNIYKDCQPDYLKISLDGYDENSYERFRGVRRYNIVRDNIKHYCEKNRHNQVGIQFVATTMTDVLKFYNANKDLPVDYISIRPVESTAGSYYKDKDVRALIKAIDWLVKIDSRVVKNFKWNMLGVQETSCIANWAQLSINEKGEVMYCCQKPYQIVGHIMDDDILEKKEKSGTNMSMCDIPCRMTAPNMFMAQCLKSRKDKEFI